MKHFSSVYKCSLKRTWLFYLIRNFYIHAKITGLKNLIILSLQEGLTANSHIIALVKHAYNFIQCSLKIVKTPHHKKPIVALRFLITQRIIAQDYKL